VNEFVLDASVVVKWFTPSEEPGSAQARSLREEYEGGLLFVVAPSLLFLEIVNVAGRRWGWNDEAELSELASGLDDLIFDIQEPELTTVAVWVSQGLTAYDAAYVALAEGRGIALVTDDQRILNVAATVARPLVETDARR
jgi:predicted nucleic acid-binding protein